MLESRNLENSEKFAQQKKIITWALNGKIERIKERIDVLNGMEDIYLYILQNIIKYNDKYNAIPTFKVFEKMLIEDKVEKIEISPVMHIFNECNMLNPNPNEPVDFLIDEQEKVYIEKRAINAIGKLKSGLNKESIIVLEKEIKNIVGSIKKETTFTSICWDDIETSSIEWLWEKKLVMGANNIIYGAGGVGKSTFAAYIAACISSGKSLKEDNRARKPEKVLILSMEDDISKCAKKRLMGLGGNPKNIHSVQFTSRDDKIKHFTLSDLDSIKQAILSIKGIKLVIIDPIAAYLGGKNSHKQSDVYELLGPLNVLAAELNICIVMIAHTSKTGGQQAKDKIQGSTAFTDACRSAIVVIACPDDKDKRYVSVTKANYASTNQPLISFTIKDGKLEWNDGFEDEDINVILKETENGTSKAKCSKLLTEMLKVAGGSMSTKDIMNDLKKEGFSTRTIYRSREDLGLISSQIKNANGTIWSLPKINELKYQEPIDTNELNF